MKIAQDANKPSEDVLPVDNNEDQEVTEEPVDQTTDFIKNNLPEQKPSELPPLDSEKLNDFISRLQGVGVTINQDDSENNQVQTEDPQIPENLNS
jgi:hypothetical protein